MSDPISTGQLDDLIGAIKALQGELSATRVVVEKSVKNSRTARVLSIISIALFLVSFGLFVSNYKTIHSIDRVRDEARVVACVQENVGIASERVAISESIVALAPPGTVFTPDQEARIAAYGDLVDKLLPFRDCSDEGIAAYYADLPEDPALEE
jgi:hypothetical protein